MEIFKIIYTVLGGLGIFFYGMKSMSDGLQAMSGDVIKKSINTLTKNRVYSLIVGVVVTCLVQSSSVTTVMVVGFVNAGLMQLTQAIGVIFGANIGTTITGWIISIKVGKYGLLFIGLGIFPYLFGKGPKSKKLGQILFSIGMVFFGLKIMSDAFKPLRTMPEFLEAVSYFSGQHYGSYIASVLVGCLLTIVVQSSSAMLGITIALASSGAIYFHTAAALVLGENIGTTITAMLASVGANANAKRAARAHAFFNLLGVVVILSIFPFYIELIDSIVSGDPNVTNSKGELPYMAIHIATGHTVFNVVASLLFLPFVKTLAAFVTRITPAPEEKEQYHLKVLGSPEDMIPSTALALAGAEILKMKEIVDRMYDLVEGLFTEKNNISSKDAVIKIKDYESILDNIQKEVSVFVVALLQKPLSPKESSDSQMYIKIADELESVSDYIERLANHSVRRFDKKILSNESLNDFLGYFNEVRDYYESISSKVCQGIATDPTVDSRKSDELWQKAESLREKHLARISKEKLDPETSLTYSDMIVSMRKIRSHSLNISQAGPKL